MKLKGTGVCDAVSIGRVYRYCSVVPEVAEAHFAEEFENQKLVMWEQAKATAADELRTLKAEIAGTDPDKAAIFAAHMEILDDEEICEMITAGITNNRDEPAWAVRLAYDTFISLLSKAKLEMMAERAADIKDVRDRLLRILCGETKQSLSLLPEKAVIVAHDLLPSDTATLDRYHVLGIITEIGGSTSHTAIIARSYGIPAVLGVSNALNVLKDGENVILDGADGLVITEPDKATCDWYAERCAVLLERHKKEAVYLNRKAHLADGTPIEIGLNVGSECTAEMCMSADFIGLLRTEFLYMNSDHLPTEEEQYLVYKHILECAGEKPVTLRTLDIGGDKTLRYLTLPEEKNPFLGKRAVRLCFEMEDLFRTQLAAALRASAYGKLQIMFPMIGSIDDIRRAKSFVHSVKRDLDMRKEPYDRDIEIGIMIEIPAIASIADLAAEEVDFASIGTNDLCQYLCAVDRMNPEIGEYYQSFSPAMVRTLASIISAFNSAGKSISVCGELAGDPKATRILAGLGLCKFSMNIASVAAVKRELSCFTLSEAKDAARYAQDLKTQNEILTFLNGGEIHSLTI